MDDKFTSACHQLSGRVDFLTNEHNQLDIEINKYGEDLSKLNVKFETILTLEDGKKIWKYFQRFVVNNDQIGRAHV